METDYGWSRFWKTGKIEDYLNYKRHELGENRNDYQNQGVNTQPEAISGTGTVPEHFDGRPRADRS